MTTPLRLGRVAGSLMLSAAALGLTLSAADAKTLRWARVADALTLDPHSQNEGPTSTLLHHIYETLVLRAEDGSLSPLLATEWYIDPEDASAWIFKLRQGVKFHDGADFTAEDVVFSFERVKSETSGFRALHAAAVSAEAIDDYTVKIKTNGPAPLYVQNLTNFFIVDKDWAEKNNVVKPQNFAAGEDNFAVRNTNGTAAYQLVSRDPEVKTVLKHFEGHWDKAPEVTEIIYTPIAEAATRVAALLSGEVDFVQDVPTQDVERLQNTDGVTVVTGPENRSIMFGYDVSSPKLRSSDAQDNPFAKQEVRDALALAVDRDAIQKVVMRGMSAPGAMPLPPFANGYDKELDAYGKPDYEKAAQLIKDAGYPDGFSVDMHCANDRYLNDEAICQAVVGMLSRANIKVNLVSQSRNLHFPLIEKSETDFYLLGWGVPPFDSQYVFDFLIHTRGGDYGSYNAGGYSDAELDKKIEGLSSMTDLEARNAQIKEIWTKVMADKPLLNIHNQVLAYATKSDVNVKVHPENQPNMSTVTYK